LHLILKQITIRTLRVQHILNIPYINTRLNTNFYATAGPAKITMPSFCLAKNKTEPTNKTKASKNFIIEIDDTWLHASYTDVENVFNNEVKFCQFSTYRRQGINSLSYFSFLYFRCDYFARWEGLCGLAVYLLCTLLR